MKNINKGCNGIVSRVLEDCAEVLFLINSTWANMRRQRQTARTSRCYPQPLVKELQTFVSLPHFTKHTALRPSKFYENSLVELIALDEAYAEYGVRVGGIDYPALDYEAGGACW